MKIITIAVAFARGLELRQLQDEIDYLEGDEE